VSLALLFPGQGSQSVGMGRDLAEAFPEARRAFEEADRALGFAISKICFDGPEEELRRTAHTQPAILTHSVAVLRVLETRRPRALEGAALAAGHSLGEYSAGVAAGAYAFGDAVRIVHERGRLMQQAVPEGIGAMAAVLGLGPDQVCAACEEAAGETGLVVSPANFNSPEQTVIAGHAEAVARASRICLERGARRAVPLPVSAPFHCALMGPAAEGLRPRLEALAVSPPRIPIVTNVDAAPAREAEQIRSALERQIASCVRWVESVEALASAGVTRAIEIGPGAVLAGLVRRTRREIPVTSVGKVEDVEKLAP
jgi:[acyl-carrier-protein] S-malonyltransferase